MNAQKAPASPVLTKVEGFKVTDSPSPVTPSPLGLVKRASVSLLSVLISESQSVEWASSSSEYTEGDDDDFHSDDEEEGSSPCAVPIHIRDEDAYKRMLRARAIVNCKLWQCQGQ